MFSTEGSFRLLERVAARRTVWLGLPFFLYVWSLSGPFVFDDLHLVLKTERYLRGESTSTGLFRFAPTDEAWRALRDRGTVPWWANPQMRVDFFRPLAEWSFWLDMRVFGRNTVGHRALSLLWFALALICAHRLFGRTAHDPVRASMATLFLGISQTLTQPVTFICNRSDLLVLVGTTLAASAYWSARTRPQLRLVLVATGCFAFALLAKEVALGFGGVVLFHALASRRRSTTSQDPATDGARIRSLIIASLMIVALAYLAYYVASWPECLSLGSTGEAATVSMFRRAVRSIPLYLAAWTTGFPISALAEASTAVVMLVGAAGVGIALLLVRPVIRMVRTDPAALFFLLWAVVFLLIGVLTIAETRVLSVASVGWAYLLSGLLRSASSPATSAKAASSPDTLVTPHRSALPAWLRHWLLTANGIISLCCAVGAVLLPVRFEQQCQEYLRQYLATDGAPLRNGDTLIVAEPQSNFELMFAGERLEFLTGVQNVGVVFLVNPGSEARLACRNDHTLVATAGSGDLFPSPAYRPWLGPGWPPRVGHEFTHRDFTATVASVSPDARVTSLVFNFHEPLASPRFHYRPSSLSVLARGER